MSAAIPTVVLGATGYVGGELLRLIATHPTLALVAAVSGSQAGVDTMTAAAHLPSRSPLRTRTY